MTHYVGLNHADSVDKLYAWLDSVVEQVVAGDRSFVKRTVLTTRVKGHFHQLKQNEHSRIEGIFGRYHVWSSQCESAGHSAGTYIAIEGAGTGSCELISKTLGPFLSS